MMSSLCMYMGEVISPQTRCRVFRKLADPVRRVSGADSDFQTFEYRYFRYNMQFLSNNQIESADSYIKSPSLLVFSFLC